MNLGIVCNCRSQLGRVDGGLAAGVIARAHVAVARHFLAASHLGFGHARCRQAREQRRCGDQQHQSENLYMTDHLIQFIADCSIRKETPARTVFRFLLHHSSQHGSERGLNVIGAQTEWAFLFWFRIPMVVNFSRR
jgi:hypothetical protein